VSKTVRFSSENNSTMGVHMISSSKDGITNSETKAFIVAWAYLQLCEGTEGFLAALSLTHIRCPIRQVQSYC
jgi:hypothetical protein